MLKSVINDLEAIKGVVKKSHIIQFVMKTLVLKHYTLAYFKDTNSV